ncbi:MAG: cyanophycinase [Bacteroidota bacterium]|nr:cyanophycinase [Bacteroidota bacterium]
MNYSPRFVWVLLVFFANTFLFAQGKLFIIGGGKRPPHLLQRLITEAGVDKKGYIVIIPMASSEQDSSIFYAKKQFVDRGITNVTGFMMQKGEILTPNIMDSIANASMIYIAGGDQQKLMDIISGTDVERVIRKCYAKGNVIAGTSAGAAVMSEKMLTGVELKHFETTEDSEKQGFQTIEANNIEIKSGLGFLKESIVDQHFIKRKRQNRLIAVAIENPEVACVGIDEATAILVKNGEAEVVGDSQVLYVLSNDKDYKTVNGKLGAKNLQMHLYVAGDKFKIK